MENNEIKMNEDVIDNVGDVVGGQSKISFKKVAVGAGLALVVGFVAYKIGKKIHATLKAKKGNSEPIDVDDTEYEEVQ